MVDQGSRIEAIEKLIVPLLEQEEAELVDLQYRREGAQMVLRVFLDKKGGISLADCEYLSDRLGSLLDEAGAIAGAYVLEVSSPGIDRVLKKENDFQRFSGKRVKVVLKIPQDGRRNFKGRLLGFENGKVLVAAEDRPWQFPLEIIEEARIDEVTGMEF